MSILVQQTKTLSQILKEHPEWADLPVVVYQSGSGHYAQVGGDGSVYIDERNETDVEYTDQEKAQGPVVVFTGN